MLSKNPQKRSMQQIAVPVLPLPELQCTTIVFFGSSADANVKDQLTFEVLKRKLSDLKDIVEGRSVVIWPVPRLHPIPKLGHVVGLAFTSVDDPIVFAMIFCQKVCYLPISSSKSSPRHLRCRWGSGKYPPCPAKGRT